MRGRDLHVSVPHPLHPSRAARCWPGPLALGLWAPLTVPSATSGPPAPLPRRPRSSPGENQVPPQGNTLKLAGPEHSSPRATASLEQALGLGSGLGGQTGFGCPEEGREGEAGVGTLPGQATPSPSPAGDLPLPCPAVALPAGSPLSLLDPRPLAGLAPFAPSRLVPRQGAGGRIQPSWPRRGPGHWCHIPEGQWQNQKQPCGPRLQRASWGRHPSVTGQWPMGTGQRGDKARNQACVLVWLWRHGWTGQSSCLLERGCLGGRGSGIGWKTLVGCGRWRNRQAGWITGGRRGFLWTRLPPWVYI